MAAPILNNVNDTANQEIDELVDSLKFARSVVVQYIDYWMDMQGRKDGKILILEEDFDLGEDYLERLDRLDRVLGKYVKLDPKADFRNAMRVWGYVHGFRGADPFPPFAAELVKTKQFLCQERDILLRGVCQLNDNGEAIEATIDDDAKPIADEYAARIDGVDRIIAIATAPLSGGTDGGDKKGKCAELRCLLTIAEMNTVLAFLDNLEPARVGPIPAAIVVLAEALEAAAGTGP